MIILIVAIFTVLTFTGFMFIEKKMLRNLVGGISLALLTLSVAGLAFHLSNYWGMKEVMTVTEKPIYTAGDTSAAYGMLIDQELGTKSGNYIFVYRDEKDDKEPVEHFKPDEDHITDSVKLTADYELTSEGSAKVVTKTTRREFSSGLMKALFGIGGEEGELVKEESRVYVPEKTWLLLTSEQEKELQKQKQENPEMAMKMMELQKSNPEEAAAMQVEQIKKVLNS